MLEFEDVKFDYGKGIGDMDEVKRAKLPGGWLIYTYKFDKEGDSQSVCFYPDPNHSWQV